MCGVYGQFDNLKEAMARAYNIVELTRLPLSIVKSNDPRVPVRYTVTSDNLRVACKRIYPEDVPNFTWVLCE